MTSDTSPDPELPDELARLLADPKSVRLIQRLIDERASKVAQHRLPEAASRLREAYDVFKAGPLEVEPGDLVVWKQGMKNKTVPAYGQPAIVVEVLDEPIVHTAESPASAYYREHLTHRLAMIDDDHDFLVYHYDGARFEKYEDPNA